MLVPRTPSFEQVFDNPEWRLLTPQEMLGELRHLVDCVQEDGIIFRSNHASNYLALASTFQKDRAAMLSDIDAALGNPAVLRPESWRGPYAGRWKSKNEERREYSAAMDRIGRYPAKITTLFTRKPLPNDGA